MELQEGDLKYVRDLKNINKLFFIGQIDYSEIKKIKHGIVDYVDELVSLAQVKVWIKISNIIQKHNDSTRKRFE